MDLYVINTQNRHKQYLIFTSKEQAIIWAKKATNWSNIEIITNIKKLTKTCDHYNLFVGE